MTLRSGRVLGVLIAVVLVGGMVALYVSTLATEPPSVEAATGPGARQAHITFQTVGSLGPRYHNADWVSYLIRDPSGKWRHQTEFSVPAGSLVTITIQQYDSATGLRNPFFSRVLGTTGQTMVLDGKTVSSIPPDSAAHTFAIPQLNVFVPLMGITDSAPKPCDAAPCTPASSHHTITFSFRATRKGRFRWQCFVPCGAGFQSGNGGPMQTFGYMAGYIHVV